MVLIKVLAVQETNRKTSDLMKQGETQESIKTLGNRVNRLIVKNTIRISDVQKIISSPAAFVKTYGQDIISIRPRVTKEKARLLIRH